LKLFQKFYFYIFKKTTDTPLDWSTGLLNKNLTHGWRGIAGEQKQTLKTFKNFLKITIIIKIKLN